MIRNKIEYNKKRKEISFSSLRLKMLGTLLFGAALAVLLLIVINLGIRQYITLDYLSEESRKERDEAYRKDLQAYVTENNLTSDDTSEIAKWAQENKYLYVLIYKDDKLLFESGKYEEIEPPKMEENKDNDVQNPSDSVENEENDTQNSPDTENGAADGTEQDSTDTTPDDGTEGGETDTPSDGTDGDSATDTDDSGDTDSGSTDVSDTDGADTDASTDSSGDTDSGSTDVSDTDGSDTDTPTDGEGDADSGSTDASDTDGSAEDNKANDSTADDKESGSNDNDDQYPSTGITVKPPSRDELIANAQQNGSYPIYTADDGVLLASMVDYTEYLYYDIANIVSITVALLAFLITMWIHFYGITKRISKLGKEVTVVAEGDMRHPIVAKGNDEITRLCMDVEYMRTSMLENVQKEHNALEANRDLITAMSHDIRTPLTVLIGYLDIMKLNAQEPEMQNYIEASERTAQRLKKMSDDMFGYFLAYGSDIEIDIQECNARTLVEQMISGHVFLLREQGYDISYNFENETVDFLENIVMVTDPPQLMRIVENIFSNIMKYADKEKPVSVIITPETDEMTIKVSNYVSKNLDEAQKNGVGLRSCMKLANAMDIRFSFEEENGVFTSVMNVPIIPNIEYGDVENENEKGGFRAWLSSVSQKFKTAISKLWQRVLGLWRTVKEKILALARKIKDRISKK